MKSNGLDATRAAKRAGPDWSLEGTVGAVERFVRAIADHTQDGYGGLAELHALANLQTELATIIDTVARHVLAHDDASYREVGAALGLTVQAVAYRYPGASQRARGGQPAHLR